MYVLKRTDQGGGYVSKPGSRSSYTRDLGRAEKFATKDEAVDNACPDNEVPVNLEHLLNRYRS